MAGCVFKHIMRMTHSTAVLSDRVCVCVCLFEVCLVILIAHLSVACAWNPCCGVYFCILDTFELIYGIFLHFGVSFNEDLCKQSDAMLVNDFTACLVFAVLR